MGQPVTVYRWDDPGAPQLSSRTPSEIIDILTKCLVDGYGAKAPLGWTRPFYDATTQAVAFRNNVDDGGSGGYVKFFSNNGTDAAGALMRITHAVSMTTIDELFHQGYTHALNAPTNAVRWALIGTSTAFYFFISTSITFSTGASFNPTIFAGDFISLLPNDAGRFISIANQGGNSTSTNWTDGIDGFSRVLNFNGINCLLIHDADGYSNSMVYALSAIYQSGITNNSIFLDTPYHPQVTYPLFIKISNESSFTISTDRLGVPLFNSLVSPTFRGVLPGMVQFMYAGYRDGNWPKTIAVADNDFWLIRNPNHGPAHLAIQLGEWNNPYVPV